MRVDGERARFRLTVGGFANLFPRPPAFHNHGASSGFANVGSCEGFRMPAAHEPCHPLGRPASENLQGRKPRERGR